MLVPVPTSSDTGLTHVIMKEPNYVRDPVLYSFYVYILEEAQHVFFPHVPEIPVHHSHLA